MAKQIKGNKSILCIVQVILLGFPCGVAHSESGQTIVTNSSTTKESTGSEASLGPEENTNLEREVYLAPLASLDLLEHKIARIIQTSQNSSWAHYLMSVLLLRIYLREPSDTSYLRASASMAAQTYELNPSSELGIVALANVLEINGETEKGLALLNEAEKRGKIDFTWRFYFAKARILAGEEKPKVILEFYKKALEDPRAIRSLVAPYVIATVISDTNSTNSIDAVLEWNLAYPCLEFGLAAANLHLRKGDSILALDAIKNARKIDPGNLDAVIMEASLTLSDFHLPKTANDLLSKVEPLKLSENMRSEFFMIKAISSLNLNQTSLSPNVLITAVKEAKDKEAGFTKIAEELLAQKRFKHALEFLKAVQTEVPGLSGSFGLAGDIMLSQLKDPVDALIAYSDAIQLDDGNPHYYSGRGLAYYQIKKYEIAMADFESAARLDPTNGSFRYNLACTLALMSRSKEALEVLASAVDLDEKLKKAALGDEDFKSIRSNASFNRILNQDSGDILTH
ncbi:MAG: tetratricopeptide repeat protein [Proteobacteria bacterium]|nr:tetratricopeptide repeat protein [Pseudomonadota bacterium]